MISIRLVSATLCYCRRVHWNVCLALAFAGLLGACASRSIVSDAPRPPPSFAEPPARDGVLAEIARRVMADNGTAHSGFRLIDANFDGLYWRLALIDSAESSLDIQTYLWYPDVSGRLLLERAILAAQRGVRVRLLIDDLLTAGLDQVLANIQQEPNVELRLFNPWRNRRLTGRVGQMIGEMERLNTRMHNKLMVVDGVAAIIGGRNIGDHYFGLSHIYNFRDLDLFGVGHIAGQVSEMFDEFWNSEWVESAANLTTAADPAIAQEQWQTLMDANRSAPELDSFPRSVRDWTDELSALERDLHIGTSEVVYDSVADDSVDQNMITSMRFLFERATEQLLITNAYIIPAQQGIDLLQGLTERGVDVRILTNSLASHDVPAVNSKYQRWRDDFIDAGADLYELRADPQIQTLTDVPPVVGEFTGLHTKAAVIDRRQVFIGSMNLDPRSANINTEMGIIADSQGLAEELAEKMLRDMDGSNAWHVRLADDGDVYWVNSDETTHRQPARGGLQRVMNTVLRVLPTGQF
jgi:putative cardiolipin synthase